MFLLVAGAMCILPAHCSEGMTVPLEGEGGLYGRASLGKYSPSDATGGQVLGSSVDQGKCPSSLLFTLDIKDICSFSVQDPLQGNPQTLGP